MYLYIYLRIYLYIYIYYCSSFFIDHYDNGRSDFKINGKNIVKI